MEDYEKYRSDLAEKIKEAPTKEGRREILNAAKETEEYQEARKEKILATKAKHEEEDQTRLKEIKNDLNQSASPQQLVERKKLSPEEARPWVSLEEKVQMPHVAGIAERIEEYSKKEGKGEYDPKVVKDILYCFLEKGIDNTKIYTSEKHEASFPYTAIDTASIAKALYRAYSGREIGELKSTVDENPPKKRMEFLFGSFQLISHGNQFTFTEEILHQIFKDLPAAIEKIEKGEEPDSNEVFVVGSPTTMTGTMSQKFLDEVKGHAFESYGDMYAELVESVLPKDESEKANVNVTLYGISMGASFAGQTAKRILEDGLVTQSRDEDDLPHMQVRIDTAPGHRSQPGFWSKVKVFGGFAASSIFTLATDKYTRDVIFKNGKYMEQVNAVLAEKGLAMSNLSPEQQSMKKAAIGMVESSLAKGVPWPEGVKATEVVGLLDTLTYDSELNREAYTQRTENPDTLGTHSIPEQGSDDIRVRSAKMTHAIPFTQRENEKRRMAAGVSSLVELKKKYPQA